MGMGQMKTPAAKAGYEQEFHRVLGEWGGDSCGVELMRALMASARLLEVLADHSLQTAGLSMPRLRLLLWLRVEERRGNKEGISPSMLSQYQHISKNTVSSLLASLEEEGLIERVLSREDKRSFKIRLTRAGRGRVSSTLPKHGAFVVDAFASLTVEEQKTLLRLVSHLRHSLHQQVSGREFGSYKT
jgi:DNA-binding MarR family transcriptional regulator